MNLHAKSLHVLNGAVSPDLVCETLEEWSCEPASLSPFSSAHPLTVGRVTFFSPPAGLGSMMHECMPVCVCLHAFLSFWGHILV